MPEGRDSMLNQAVIREQLANGLTVLLLPKPGFRQTYATFTTKFGSVDNEFCLQGETDSVIVPDGTAHFLEHKMFESKSEDVFSQFARHGASANAFTSFGQTTYLFSSTGDIEANLETLLDFVQDPYFTDENVAKEKGIIGQEIRMYDDNPEWQGFFGLLRALYAEHPVRTEIAGTVESIAKIDCDILYRCYRTFYHPSNMVLVVTGGFDAQQLATTIRNNQAAKTFDAAKPIVRPNRKEPTAVAAAESRITLSVSQPRCLIGWKDATTGIIGHNLLQQDLLTGVLLDSMFGKSSDFYHRLIDERLIDQQFTWEYEVTPAYGYSLIGGNTSDPQKLLERVAAEIESARRQGIRSSDFERSRRKNIGRFVSSLDSPTFVARNYLEYYLKEADMFETVQILEDMTLAEANARLERHFQSGQQAASIVLPRNDGEAAGTSPLL